MTKLQDLGAKISISECICIASKKHKVAFDDVTMEQFQEAFHEEALRAANKAALEACETKSHGWEWFSKVMKGER